MWTLLHPHNYLNLNVLLRAFIAFQGFEIAPASPQSILWSQLNFIYWRNISQIAHATDLEATRLEVMKLTFLSTWLYSPSEHTWLDWRTRRFPSPTRYAQLSRSLPFISHDSPSVQSVTFVWTDASLRWWRTCVGIPHWAGTWTAPVIYYLKISMAGITAEYSLQGTAWSRSLLLMFSLLKYRAWNKSLQNIAKKYPRRAGQKS